MKTIEGIIVTIGVEVPTDAEIRRQAARASANGFALRGSGPFRRVAGGKVGVVVVGPRGCTCHLGRQGEWCHHRSLLAVELGQVAPPATDAAGSRRPVRRQRRGYLPRPSLPRPVVPRFRMPDGSPTPMDRLRERNRASWQKAA